MPTKTGRSRPRAGLGLASNMPANSIHKRPGKVVSAAVKSSKPAANTVARREKRP
jgi:hypothetical protein